MNETSFRHAENVPKAAAGARSGAPQSLDLAALSAAYAAGSLSPTQVVALVLDRIAARGDDHVWIHVLPRAELMAMAARLEAAGPAGKRLYGLPFALKDNIDLAGHPTTAACPAFAHTPGKSAFVVERLIAAGAIPIGKTNLDQFATGLNGTRSPYGIPSSALSGDHLAGGSSSGSAVAVAAGLVSFALGTDTAGSGRVPAQFNNIVGLKPTRGLISTTGVLPACRSLDCVSIFALSADDARDVLAVAKGFDPADPYSRREMAATLPSKVSGARFGVPRTGDLEFFGNSEGARLFAAMVDRIAALGGTIVEIDITPFLETAKFLYEGPWVAERYAAIRDFIETQPDALHPVTREIMLRSLRIGAVDTFEAFYRLEALRRATEPAWQKMDVLVTPTAGRHYTIAEMLADPIKLNSDLGTYTNFMNLLDLAAIAVPAGFQKDGLPFGITLAGPAGSDAALCALGDTVHRAMDLSLGALDLKLPSHRPAAVAATTIRLAVCGAHMEGLPLNRQLTDRGARLVRRCRTAPAYRLYALPGGPPARPGMVREDNGRAIEVEVWEMPLAAFGAFVEGIPPPLAIGTVELEDGERVKGFLCEAHGTIDARDITELGGWRRYLAEAKAPLA
jgi:allophanate hydrolase